MYSTVQYIFSYISHPDCLHSFFLPYALFFVSVSTLPRGAQSSSHMLIHCLESVHHLFMSVVFVITWTQRCLYVMWSRFYCMCSCFITSYSPDSSLFRHCDARRCMLPWVGFNKRQIMLVRGVIFLSSKRSGSVRQTCPVSIFIITLYLSIILWQIITALYWCVATAKSSHSNNPRQWLFFFFFWIPTQWPWLMHWWKRCANNVLSTFSLKHPVGAQRNILIIERPSYWFKKSETVMVCVFFGKVSPDTMWR